MNNSIGKGTDILSAALKVTNTNLSKTNIPASDGSLDGFGNIFRFRTRDGKNVEFNVDDDGEFVFKK